MKKKPVIHPSDCVRDEFRMRNAGLVEAPFNSKSSTDNFHVDRSRLGTHEEYVPSSKPNEFGRYEKVSNHIKESARRNMGDLKQRSSFVDINAKADCGTDTCCEPVNPLYKKRHRR